MFVSFISGTTGVTSGSTTANHSGEPEFTRFVVAFALLNLVVVQATSGNSAHMMAGINSRCSLFYIFVRADSKNKS